jgi:hypothetical protein
MFYVPHRVCRKRHVHVSLPYLKTTQCLQNKHWTFRFADSLLSNSFELITVIINVMARIQEGRHMDRVDKFHIYKATKLDIKLNDKHAVIHNPIL